MREAMRGVGAFQTSQSKRRYWLVVGTLVVAALLFTAGLVNWINFDPFKGQMTTLPVYAYRQYSQGLVPCKGGGTCIADINYQRAWAAALALIILVMALNIIARAIATAVAPKGRN